MRSALPGATARVLPGGAAGATSGQVELEPDVRRPRVHPPAVRELRDELEAPAALAVALSRVPPGRLEALALVGHSGPEASPGHAGVDAHGTVAAVLDGVRDELRDEQPRGGSPLGRQRLR